MPPLPPAEPRASRGCRVLLVGDGALVRIGTAAMLDDLGHRVTEDASGREALDLLRAGTAVDVMATDQAIRAPAE